MMLNESDVVAASPKNSKTLAYAVALFAWAETYVLVGLQYFWALGKSYPLSTENWWTGAVAFSPFVVSLAVGLFACSPRVRVALVRLEPWLHLTASVLLFALIAIVTAYDPFDRIVPFSWSFHLWAVAISFVVLANMARLQRRILEPAGDADHGSRWPIVAATVAIWGIVLAAALMTRSLVWCWAIELAAHVFMGPYAATTPLCSIASAPFGRRALTGLAALCESAALAVLVLTVSIGASLAHPVMGAPELKFQSFFQPYVSFGFAVGVLVAAIAQRFKLSWIAFALAVGAAVFEPWHAGILLSVLLGYAIARLAILAKRQGPLAYAVSALVLTAVWFVVFTFFVVGPIAGSVEPVKSVSGPIVGLCVKAVVTLFVVAAVLALLQRLFQGNASVQETPRTTPALGVWIYAGSLVLAFLPSLAILVFKSAPPLCMHRADRIAVREPMGVCHAGHSDSEYTTLKQLGVKTVRADFHWRDIQPNPDTWDFSRYDRYVDTAAKHGVKVLALLAFDNNAVERDPVGKTRDKYIAPSDIPLFEEYVRRVVKHFKGRVSAFEIWNEPSLDRFWTGTPAEFYELAKRTASAVRSVDPDATIVGTAMHAPFGVWTPHQTPGLFAYGAMDQVDHPAFHLYIGDPRAYANEFSKFDGLNRANGHPGSLSVTEIGDPDGGGYPWRVTPDKLADHVIKSFVTATSFGMKDIVWYCFEDTGADGQRRERGDSEHFFGLLGPGRQWKPAAHAYRLFCTSCCNSEIRSDILDRTGGLTARQVRTSLYRRDNGDSVLILWYEPTLSG